MADVTLTEQFYNTIYSPDLSSRVQTLLINVGSQLHRTLELPCATKFLSQRAPVTSEAERSVGEIEKWERGTVEESGWTEERAEAAQTAQLLARL